MRFKNPLPVFGIFCTIASAAAGSQTEMFRYDGVCEASAAAILDAAHFAVASDETEVLTIYERGNAVPVSTHVLSGVTDLEAAARFDDTIFWLTSHSLNKHGKNKKKRKRLFATKVENGTSIRDAGTTYRDLRAKIASLLAMDEATVKTTLDIEGLATTLAGDLLIGLRGPLNNEGKAFVVKIDNPFALVGLSEPQGVKPRDEVAPVSTLDLGGRGIRSIERVGTDGHAFVIVAGSVEDGAKPPALYWWDGVGEAMPGPEVSLNHMTPEALIIWNKHQGQVLGDNGDACSDKKPNPRWFQSIDLTFP